MLCLIGRRAKGTKKIKDDEISVNISKYYLMKFLAFCQMDHRTRTILPLGLGPQLESYIEFGELWYLKSIITFG